MPTRYSSFAEIVQRGQQMLEALARHGVSAKPGSVLLRCLASAREAQRHFETQSDLAETLAGNLVRDLANLSMLSNSVLMASPSLLAQAHHHLHALAQGDPGPTTPGVRSQARSFAFELICASACDRFASNTQLKEPDVTCLFEESTWGLACKTVSGNPESAVSAIRKGIAQLEATNCNYGLLVLQVTDLFPHDEMRRRHSSTSELTQHLLELVVKTAGPIVDLAQARFNQHGNWPGEQVRGVLFLAHTIGYLDTAHVLGTGELRAFHPPFSKDLEGRFGTDFQRALEGLY